MTTVKPDFPPVRPLGPFTQGIEPPFPPGAGWLRVPFKYAEDTMKYKLQTVTDIPKAWRDIFANIRDALPGSLMAGGCLRDHDLSVKVNDIDIFVPEAGGKWDDLVAVEAILKQLGADKVEIMNDKAYPTGVDNHIVGVVEAKFVSCPIKFQLVIGNWGMSIPDLFKCFDFGICMIAYDGKGLHHAPDYVTDRRDKKFRFATRRSRTAFQQSIERYARLKPKFSDWKFDLGVMTVQDNWSYATGGYVDFSKFQSRGAKFIADQFKIIT